MGSHVASPARARAFSKYLVALTFSLKTEQKRSVPSVRKQQLCSLYLLNDLLHQFKYHGGNESAYASFLEGISGQISDCICYAADYDSTSFPRHKERIQRLLEEWSRNGYFEKELQRKLQEIVSTKTGQSSAEGKCDSIKKETPYIMPAIHGDPSAPYHELPAGNMMPHIIPNTSLPINPRHMQPLQFESGPAEPALVEAVKLFLEDVDILYNTGIPDDEGISMELDDLGQNVVRDKETGGVLRVESYYGWSKEFCERMKQKQSGRRRSPSRGSSSPGRSIGPRKRRRYGSVNGSRNLDRSRSYSYSRSRSRSRSTTPPPLQRNGMSRGRSGSYSRSRSQPRRFNDTSPPSRASTMQGIKPSSSQTFFPPQPPPPPPPPPTVQQPPQLQQQIHLPPQPAFSQRSEPPPLPPPSIIYNNSMSQPLAPPRPLNWQGPWPPAPPPPPPHHSLLAAQVFTPIPAPVTQGYGAQNPQYYLPNTSWQGTGMPGVSVPPPPPPPSGNDPYGHGYGQGYNQQGTYGDRDRGRGQVNGRGRGGRW